MAEIISEDVLEQVSIVHEFERATAVRQFIIGGIDNPVLTTRPWIALNDPSIPQIGDAWPDQGFLPSFAFYLSIVCVRRECVPVQSSTTKYRITCYYGWVDAVTGPAQDPTIEPDPSDGRPWAKYSYGGSLQTVETIVGKELPVSGIGPASAAGPMLLGYETPGTDQVPLQVFTASKQEVIHSMVFQRHEDRHVQDSGFDQYQGKINSSSWNGYDAGRVLCTRISSEPQFGRGRSNRGIGQQSYIATYEFQALPNSIEASLGWDVEATYKDPNGNPIADPEDDITKKRFRLYEEADFGTMFLVPS